MRMLFTLLLLFAANSYAEEQQPVKQPDKQADNQADNQIYSEHSKLTVENLNKTVEIIRDPTEMSSNFRSALRNLPNRGGAEQTKTDEAGFKALNMPEIELVGKVFSENGPPTVVFKARGKYHHFEEGEQVSKVINNQVVTIHVQEITEESVRILVMPFNKTLIFN